MSPQSHKARFRGHLEICHSELGGGGDGATSDASVTVSISGGGDGISKKATAAAAERILNASLLKRKTSSKVSEDDLFSIDPDVESRLAALCDQGKTEALGAVAQKLGEKMYAKQAAAAGEGANPEDSAAGDEGEGALRDVELDGFDRLFI